MIPGSFSTYFAVGASASPALVGLLFVAISLRPESIIGETAGAGGRALAGSTSRSWSTLSFSPLAHIVVAASLLVWVAPRRSSRVAIYTRTPGN